MLTLPPTKTPSSTGHQTSPLGGSWPAPLSHATDTLPVSVGPLGGVELEGSTLPLTGTHTQGQWLPLSQFWTPGPHSEPGRP